MRHSVRADSVSRYGGVEWTDMQSRPYDTPICDFELPASQAEQIRPYQINTVISSPFRRCLQTSGVVCRTLGIESMYVDYGLSEGMFWARSSSKPVIDYLSPEQMQEAVGERVTVIDIKGIPPFMSESIEDSFERIQQTFVRLLGEYAGRNFLCVSHKISLEAMGRTILRPPRSIHNLLECGFIVSTHDGEAQHNSRVELGSM